VIVAPDGTEVLVALRRDTPVPAIMLSASWREHDRVRALDLWADDYLTKAFGVDELLARVRVDGRDITLTPKQYNAFLSGA
jgi:two-component system KDP operon response regulator KdpE